MTNVDEGGTPLPGIEPIEIQEEMEPSFLEYSMSVIVSRALPDARDGLKPVHRRILWGMHDMGARSDRPRLKCARVSGEVMGKYHPHGESAIYDALVRMAQDFSLRHPLVDGQGNFGSPDDPPASQRYTECRLAPIANVMLAGIDEDTVDFIDNYSGEFTQPEVLPARFPNLLVNGSQGIAVGMATNIPPHNLGEVIDATTHLIDNPEATPDDLMRFVKGPDFPTGALILGRAGILKRIVELVEARELEGIADLNDDSAGDDTRLSIKLKRDANASVVLNNLFKHTPLQTSFGVNMVALVDGVPCTLNLRDALVAYVNHQIEVIRRRSEFRLRKAKERAHIVEGLLKALDMIDEIIALIRGSENTPAAREGLMAEPFSFTEVQAQHILDMTLSRLTRLGRSQLEDEMGELRTRIADLEAILSDEGKLRSVIKEELAEVRNDYATPRKAEITFDPGDMAVED